jgi:hypothetical protein
MGNTISAFAPNCRVFILIDDVMQSDYTTNPQKSFYKLNSIQNLSSTISVEDGGSAQLRLNDKDMKFRKYFPFKYLNTRTFGDEKIETKNEQIALSDLNREPLPVALTNAQEIVAYRKLLSTYGEKQDALKVMKMLAEGESKASSEPEKHGGLLVPMFTPQNLIWIHYLGRDGYWYKKFSGIITKVSDSDVTKKTPEMSLECRTYDRMLDYSQIITGVSNIGSLKNTEIPSLKNQKQTLSSVNKYAGKTFSEIVIDVFRTTNQFFIKDRVEGRDYRYFKVKDIFGFGDNIQEEKIEVEPKENLSIKTFGTTELSDTIKKKLSGNWAYSRITGTYYTEDGTFIYNDKGKTESEILNNNESKTTKVSKQLGEDGYPISDKKFELAKYKFDESIDISNDFYPGSEVINNKEFKGEKEWIQVIMADDFFGDRKPFQNLVKTSLTLFNTEKQTPNDILRELKNIVLAYIYFDGDGTVKIERPYFDIDISSIIIEDGVFTDEVPPDFDNRYIISKKDISYKSSNFSDNESSIVTRVELQANPDFVTFETNVAKSLQGYSNSSFKTISKYGERFVTLKPIVTQKFRSTSQAEDILNSYCYAQKLLLTSDSKSLDFQLDQRPDLQINRPLLDMDRGMVTLITSLTESFDFSKHIHTTSVKGKYTRYVGDRLINPWRKKIRRPDSRDEVVNDDGSIDTISSGWVLDDWGNGVDPINNDISTNLLGVGIDVLEKIGSRDNTETYDSIKNSLTSAINSLNPSFNFQENKYTCYIIRSNRDNVKGFDSFNPDTIYFLWNENGVGKWEKFNGCGGDPQTNEGRFKTSSYREYAKLVSGIYRYGNIATANYNNKNSTLVMNCDDFSFVKIKRDVESNFINSTEILNSNGISVSTIHGKNIPLVSNLSNLSIPLYNKLDGIESSDRNICYDSLGIVIDGNGLNQNSNNPSSNDFITTISKNQNYMDVIIHTVSNNKSSENPKYTEETGTNLPKTNIMNVFMYLYAIHTSNVNDKPSGISLKDNGLRDDDILPTSNINGRRGMYLVTENFTGITKEEKLIEFRTKKSAQDLWFSEYVEYINKVINSDKLIYRVNDEANGVSIQRRINLITGNNNSDFLSVSAIEGGKIQIYLNKAIDINNKKADFPINNVENTISGIVALIHIGFMEAMINNPDKDFKSIYDNNFNTVIKYLAQYYLFYTWDETNLNEPVNQTISIIKDYKIDSETLAGNRNIWKIIKLMSNLQ